MKEFLNSYESPQVEVISIEVEKGFAVSDPYGGLNEPGSFQEGDSITF